MSSLYEITAPCFSCYCGHSCKYYENPVWCQWILENNKCPAFLYPYESMLTAIEKKKEEQSKKLGIHQYNFEGELK